jgi:hypothetical protein
MLYTARRNRQQLAQPGRERAAAELRRAMQGCTVGRAGRTGTAGCERAIAAACRHLRVRVKAPPAAGPAGTASPWAGRRSCVVLEKSHTDVDMTVYACFLLFW